MPENQRKSKTHPQKSSAQRSDAELDALWKTFDLNDKEDDEHSKINPTNINLAQPKSSNLNKLKLYIEKYIPGGRFFLHSFYFPIWRANLNIANEWQNQLQTLLSPLLPDKAIAHLKNNRVAQLFFAYSSQDPVIQPKGHKKDNRKHQAKTTKRTL